MRPTSTQDPDDLIVSLWLEAALDFANSTADASSFRGWGITRAPKQGWQRLRAEWRACLKSPEMRMRDWCVKNAGLISAAVNAEYGEDHIDDDGTVTRHVRLRPGLLPAPTRITQYVNRPEFILSFVGFVLLLPQPPFKVAACLHPRHGRREHFFLWPRRRGRNPDYCPECVAMKRRPSDKSTARVRAFRKGTR
jgi:hypothetical protein